jgi:uncharacterized protein (TIGR00251 family)
VILEVRVIPNASRTAITEMRGQEVVVRVNAPAIEGKANRAALRYLARAFGVRSSAVRLVSGEKSRHKKIEIVGLDSGELTSTLADLLDSGNSNP